MNANLEIIMGTAQVALQVGAVCCKSVQYWKIEMELVCFYVDPTTFPCKFLHWEKSLTQKHIKSSFLKKSKLWPVPKYPVKDYKKQASQSLWYVAWNSHICQSISVTELGIVMLHWWKCSFGLGYSISRCGKLGVKHKVGWTSFLQWFLIYHML